MICLSEDSLGFHLLSLLIFSLLFVNHLCILGLLTTARTHGTSPVGHAAVRGISRADWRHAHASAARRVRDLCAELVCLCHYHHRRIQFHGHAGGHGNFNGKNNRVRSRQVWRSGWLDGSLFHKILSCLPFPAEVYGMTTG